MSESTSRHHWWIVGGLLAILVVAGLMLRAEWKQPEQLDAHIVTDLAGDSRGEVLLFRSEGRRGMRSARQWVELLHLESDGVRRETASYGRPSERFLSRYVGEPSRVLVRRGDHVLVRTEPDERNNTNGLAAFDVDRHEVAWRASVAEMARVEPGVVFGPSQVLVRHRTERGLRISSFDVSTGEERWKIPGASWSPSTPSHFEITEERIYQYKSVDSSMEETSERLRIIEASSGDVQLESSEFPPPSDRLDGVKNGTTTDEGFLYLDEMKRKGRVHFAGWNPRDEAERPETSDSSSDDDSSPVQVPWRIGPDETEPDPVEIDRRPVRVPTCKGGWTVHAGRILCLHDSPESIRLSAIPYRADASGFRMSIPGDTDMPTEVQPICRPAWTSPRTAPARLYPFHHRYVLFDVGARLAVLDLQAGRATWVSEPIDQEGEAFVKKGLVTRSGPCLFEFKAATAAGDGEPADWSTSFVSFDASSGRFRGTARLVDADSGEEVLTRSMSPEWFRGDLFVPEVLSSQDFAIWDVRQMELVYGPRLELRDRTEAWTRRFESAPVASPD